MAARANAPGAPGAACEPVTISNVHDLPPIGIGEAARLYGLTLRAIRFYEEKGLVMPRRDRLNNRYYDGRARTRLGWISLLRSAGLGLQDIREVLRVEDRTGSGRRCAQALLQARRCALEAELNLLDMAQRGLTAGSAVIACGPFRAPSTTP